jgi:hypothetical protein
VLAGQVRFQWVASVSLEATIKDGQPLSGITLWCQDGDMVVRVILTMTTKTSGPAVEQIATDVARGLVHDIARFRLATRADQLGPDRVRQLTLQRDNPVPDDTGPRLRWKLEGGLRVGQPPDLVAYRRTIGDRLDAMYEEATGAMGRYQLHGRAGDMEQGLRLGRALLEEVLPGSRDELAYMNLYAGALHARYGQYGDLSDLSSVIGIMRDVVKRTEFEEPEWQPDALTNLGDALLERFRRGLDAHDREEGIVAHEKAVAATAHDSPNWVRHASGLASALNWRYMRTRDAGDLDRVIDLYGKVLSRIAPSSQEKANCLVNLASALVFRYRYTGNRDGVDRAVQACKTALELMPRKALHRGTALFVLAGALDCLHDRDRDPVHLQAAVQAWREGCRESRASSQANVLQGTLNWSAAMARSGDWAAVVEACDIGLAAAEHLFRLQLTREDKGLWLEEGHGLPARAGYALAKLGDLQRAAAVVERGRAVFMSEALERDHADLDGLAMLGHHDLAERYRHAAARLTDLERADQGIPAVGAAPPPGAQAEVSRAAQAELDQAIAAIRAVKGYEAFMAPPNYAEVLSAAADAPLAYIVTTEHGGFALIVDGRTGADPEPTVVWLDNLTDEAIVTMARDFGRFYYQPLKGADPEDWHNALDSVTRRLWDIVMGPLLSAVPTDRLTVIPGSLLALLPLHAAWTEDPSARTGRRYVLDDALVTYAPSARARHFARRLASERRTDRILAVCDTDLRNTESEAQAALRWFSDGKMLRKDQASRKTLLAELPGYSVLHFSCHGSARDGEPLESTLHAARDGDLTLRDLLEQPLCARLAVLSACETAVSDSVLPDEVVGLPTGLLQAGAAGVVGSLWLVGDRATRALMTRFYELWRNDGLEPAQALRQAQRWVRDTDTLSKQAFLAQASRADPEAHPRGAQRERHALEHEHPAHWAGFIYVGV